MTDAQRDTNVVTTLLAVSSDDGKTPITLYADPVTHRLLVNMVNQVTNGDGAPGTTPTDIGLFYVDYTNKKLYVSTGTASSADWTITN